MSASAGALSPLALYGRKYELQIKFPPDSRNNQTVITLTADGFEPEALRIVFDVHSAAWQMAWYADISIWNLDQVTTDQILGDQSQTPSGIQQGMEVILKAGYQSGNFGVIWDGFVFQSLWDRENVTDFKITLHCVVWLEDASRNVISQVYAAGTSQQQAIRNMANDSFHKIDVDQISSLVNAKGSIRGEVFFGNPAHHLQLIADDNNMQTWLSAKGLSMASPGNSQDVISSADVVVYTPETGLIGTPQQTELGANFRVLLDPRIQAQKPYMQVKIDQAVIRQQKRQLGILPGSSGLGLLDQDGTYIVLGVRHSGDSRGQPWYTDVTGVSSAVGAAGLLNVIGANLSQGGMWTP